MRDDLTSQQVNTATMAVSRMDLTAVAAKMPQESFAFLCEILFAVPTTHVQIGGEPYVVRNNPEITNDAAIDLLQVVIGPGKIQRPVRCFLALLEGSIWRPVSLRKRVVTRVIRDYYVA